MKVHRNRFGLAGILAGMLVLAGVATAAPASASDSYVYTDSRRPPGGILRFIDYGPGVRGNGKSNDDYFVVDDNLPDGHGVKAWVWIGSELIDDQYNGGGFGDEVIWDPVQISGDKYIGMKVCLVDGTNDRSPGPCGRKTHFEID